jgi:hypothetical protein
MDNNFMPFQPVVDVAHLLDYFLMMCTFFSAVQLIRALELSNWSALSELIYILPAPSDA